MKLLLFILLCASTARFARRFLLPRPRPGQERPRLGFARSCLVGATALVLTNVVTSALHAGAGCHRRRGPHRAPVEALAETTAAPAARPGRGAVARELEAAYRAESRRLEARLAAAKAAGTSYEAAQADPELSRALDRLVEIRLRLTEIESAR